jgi:hypothetical protein
MRPQLHAQSNEVWKVNSFMITLYVNYSVKVFFFVTSTLLEKSSKYLLTCKWNKEGAKYLDRNVIFSITSPWIGLFPCTIRSQNCDYLVPRGTSSVY